MADFAGEILNFINTGIDAGISAISNYKQFKRSKALMDYQNNINKENFAAAKTYQNYLNNNEFSIKMNAAKQAGLSPMAAIAGSNFNSQVGAIPSPTAAPSPAAVPHSNLVGAYQAVAAMKQAESQSALTDSQARLNNAHADKLETETTGVDLNNQLLSGTLKSQIKLTNEQNELWTQINSKIKSNPDFLEAYAGEKYLQNQQLKSSTKLNDALTELNKALEEKAKADVIKTKEETLLVQANRSFTNAQKKVLLDQNFRDNHNNVTYLLEAINKTYDDPKLSESEKAQKISVYNAALENCSNVAAFGRELKKIKAQEDSNINVEHLRGENAIENTKEFGRQNRQTNREQVENAVLQRLVDMPLDEVEKFIKYDPDEDKKKFSPKFRPGNPSKNPANRTRFQDGRIQLFGSDHFRTDWNWKFYQDGWKGQ